MHRAITYTLRLHRLRTADGQQATLAEAISTVAVAQLAARRSHNPKVVRSILTRRTFSECCIPPADWPSHGENKVQRQCCEWFAIRAPYKPEHFEDCFMRPIRKCSIT